MALVAGPVLAGTVSVVVDAGARRHPISPEIYGVNGGDDEQLQRMGVTVRRWGFGNLATGYNWKTGMTNHARDWYFEAIPGSERAVDPWSAATLARGARPLIQLTTTGWITKGDGTARYCGF
ncbi:MAG TPA: hypothetical protein VND93_32695, partial [Myxococcales bacterium]|nr:hypothetical protein [Myxococcales bacterium]